MISLKPVKVRAFVYRHENGEVTIAMAGKTGPIIRANSEPEARALFNNAIKTYFALFNFKTFVEASQAQNTNEMLDAFSANYGKRADVEFIELPAA